MDPERRTVLKLVVAYDGVDFQGSQRHDGRRTVEGVMLEAVRPLADGPVRLSFAGRTDAGVHAVGQIASVQGVRTSLDGPTIVAALNARLPDDLRAVGGTWIESDFHARFDARWREYRYRLWCGPEQPLARRTAWQRAVPFDIRAMEDGASRLRGRHDLASFAGGGEGVPWSERSLQPRGTVRTVIQSFVRETNAWWGIPAGIGLGIEFRIAADGFLPQTVRSMVGALVLIGQHRRPSSWIDELIATADRRQGPPTAPPHGLILWRVGYGDEVPDPDVENAPDME